MFKEDNLIIKIHGSDRFIAVREAFAIGKVKFEFRIYDKNKADGGKIKQSVDIYMDIDKFTVFCQYLKDGSMQEKLKEAERQLDLGIVNELINTTRPDMQKLLALYGTWSVSVMDALALKDLKDKLLRKLAKQGGDAKSYAGRTPASVFEDYGGRKVEGKVFSRVLNVTSGTKYPILLKASEGPGRSGNNGQIIPSYKEWNQGNSHVIQIPLSEESAVAMGIAGLRAIAVYDLWASSGQLEKRLERIHPKRNSSASQGGTYPQDAGNIQGGSGYDAGSRPSGYQAGGASGLRTPLETGQFRSAKEPYAEGGATYREMQTSVKRTDGYRSVLF